MFAQLRKLFWQVVSYFRPDAAAMGTRTHETWRPAPEAKSPENSQARYTETARLEATPTPAPSQSSSEVARIEPPVEPKRAGLSRKQRRALDKYERARLKQDKFVTPQGPQPIKPEHRTQPRPLPRPIDVVELIPDVHDAEGLIIDKINDVDEDVLIKESEIYGEFNFRDSILDQIDRYWVYLERMKKHDPDSYGFYKQVGATIVPRIATGTYSRSVDDPIKKMTKEEIEQYKKEVYLPPWFNTHRPSFGCIAWGAHSLSEKHEIEESHGKKWMMIPKFLYFSKYKKPPPEVQPMSGGDVYRMTIWWDRPQDKKHKWGKPNEFAVFVNKKGTQIQVLRQLDTKIMQVPRKHSSWDYSSVPQRAWRIPDDYEQWAHSRGIDAQLHLAHLFCHAINKQETSNYSMVRVAVTKGDLTATFGVAVKRMAYFFQDRDIRLTGSGHKKPIFHLVRPYTRSDGVHVKMHFSGEQHFSWAGYDVNITVPGLDHFLLQDIDIGFEDSYWHDKKEKYLSEPEIGKFLVDKMKAGLGSGK